MKHSVIETRSAAPLETREDDHLAMATAAVEELRSAAEQRHAAHQTELRTANDRIAALETRLNRSGSGAQQEQRDQVDHGHDRQWWFLHLPGSGDDLPALICGSLPLAREKH